MLLQRMTKVLPTSATKPRIQMQTRSTRLDIRSSHEENSSAAGRHVRTARARQHQRNSSVSLPEEGAALQRSADFGLRKKKNSHIYERKQ